MPGPQAVAHVRADAVDPALVAVETHREVPAVGASTQKSSLKRRFSSSARARSECRERVVAGLGRAVRRARRARRTRTPAPRTARSASARACRRRSASSPRSPSNPGSAGRGRSCAGTRRSRRRPCRRSSVIHSSARSAAGSSASTSSRRFPHRDSSPTQHDEQRRRVDGAVVDATAAERERRGLAEAHLVQDAARLLLACAGRPRVPWKRASVCKRAEREVGVDEHRHPRREQRVAAEQRHEPRRTRGDDRPVGELGIEDAQPGEVLRRPLEQRAGTGRRRSRPPGGAASTPRAARPASSARPAGRTGSGA